MTSGSSPWSIISWHSRKTATGSPGSPTKSRASTRCMNPGEFAFTRTSSGNDAERSANGQLRRRSLAHASVTHDPISRPGHEPGGGALRPHHDAHVTLGAGMVVENEGRAGARQLLGAVVGCNVAWGIID